MATVRQWLEDLGLGQYEETFGAEKIEIRDLSDLAEADLEKLGIPMGPRKRLLRAIAEIGSEAAHRTVAEKPAPRPRAVPAALAKKFLSARAAIEGERKQVSVLFADIEGSTDLVQHLDAEEVSALFDPLQKIMIEAVHAYEGTVNEVLGDGLMAIFGAPIAHEDHALRACRAALDMQEAVHEWAAQSAPGSPARALRLRVGLNSGGVVVRALNNDLTISYSAMGATTHLAARMEQTAEPGTVRISGDTHRLVTGLVDARALGEIAVKGVAQPVPVFELHSLGQARTRLEAAASLSGLTRFVGRELEMRVLEERFAEAAAGHGQAVGIVGDAGIGKSRLLIEFQARLGGRANWVAGHAVSFGRSMAFHALIDLLRCNFRIGDHDDADTIQATVATAIRRIGPGLEPVVPYLLYMLGAAPAGDPVHELAPRIRRAEIFDALCRLLLRAAGRKPQVLVFEDLHWSDSATQEFLTYLLDRISRARALVLLTFRPGYDDPMEGARATRLGLDKLSAADSAAMAEAVLASADLPAELHALIRRKAEGNPFFVEELIKALGENGAIGREGERWVLARPLDQITVPDTIQDVLMSRIDRLEEEPRRALQFAAVIGREFTGRLLERIAESHAGTTTALERLQAIELIDQKASFPEPVYMFKHALTQDVAYGSLLTQRRRDLHRRIGAAIEELYADRLAEHYAVLAHHFARGEDWPRAATYFDQAAQRAVAASAVKEALALCDQAIEALDRNGESVEATRRKSDLHARKAGLLMLVSDFERAHGEHREAAMLARRLGNRARRGAAVAGMALASLRAHRFERAFAESGRAFALGRALGSGEIAAAGKYTTGMVNGVTGHLAEARGHLEQACELGRSGGSVFYEAQSSAVVGLIENWRGDYAAATAKVKKAVAFARDHNHPFALLQDVFYLGLPLAGQGRYDEALATFTEGLELAAKLGDEIFRNRFLNCLGWVLAECGDLERATELNQRGVGVSKDRGDPETIANCKLNLADIYLVERELGLARELLESVHGLVRKPSTSDWMKWRYSQHLFVGLGEVWLAMDDPARAASFCNQCLDLATRTDSKKYLVRGWRLRAAIAAARRQWEEAEETLATALGLARRMGSPTQLWQTHLALGRLQRDTRRTDPARASFAAARQAIDGIGRGLRTPELRQGFERSPLFPQIHEQIEAG